MKDSSFFTAIVIFSCGIFITALLSHSPQEHAGSVLGRSYPLAEADIKVHAGGTITVEGISLIVSENTFDQDVYFRVDRTLRGNPIEVNGLWQVSDIWEARVKFMSNNDQVSEYAARKKYILAFPYSRQNITTDQGIALPESSLKLIRGETVTGPWTVMEQSVVDTANTTVSVITNRGGFFMIAGGFYSPPQPTTTTQNTISAQSARTRTVTLQENEIIVTLTPTPSPPEQEPHTNRNELDDTTPQRSGDKPPVQDTNFFTALYSLITSLFR